MALMLQPCWRSDASVTLSSGCKCSYLVPICVHYPWCGCCTSDLRPPTETSGDIRNFFVSYLTHILKLTQIRDKPRSNTLMGNFPCERICRPCQPFLQSRPVCPSLAINTSHLQRFGCYRMTLPEKHPCAGPFQRLSWPSFLSDARICSAVRAPPSSATRDGR